MEYMSKYIYDRFREVIGSKSRFLQKIINNIQKIFKE